MRNKVFIFLTIALAISTLTGCWDIYEIRNHEIVTLTGVDKVGDNVKLFLEYEPPHGFMPESIGAEGQKPNILIGEGKTLVEARNSYLRKSSDDVFLGAVSAIVFSDSYAKNGIEEYLTRVRGSSEYSKNVRIFTTTAELENIFDSKSLNTTNIGFDIEHMSSQLDANNICFVEPLSTALESMQVKNTGYLLNNLDIVEKKIEVVGYSIFNDNKKIGLIPKERIKDNNYFLLNNASADYVIDFEDATISLKSKLKKRKIDVYYDKENISFNIKISLECKILNTSKMIKIDNAKMKEVSDKISSKVQGDIYDAIETSQIQYGCDYLYLYKSFRAKYNTDFRKINWNEKYKTAKFNVSVNAKVLAGNMINFN